jgi:uncharacterized delta-60 repeat protein
MWLTSWLRTQTSLSNLRAGGGGRRRARPQPRLRARPQVEALEDRWLLSAGALDPTFGSGGTVTTNFGNNTNTSAQVLVIQPDGKIVAAGDSENTGSGGYYNLARYNADGSLDATFGSKGEVQTKFNTRVAANAMVLQPDGKILLAGGEIINSVFEVVRYNSDGSLDTTFGHKGMVSTSFAQGGSEAWSLGLETVGGVIKIVAAGDVVVLNQTTNIYGLAFGLARYNLDGSLDTSFGSGGRVVTNISTYNVERDMAGVVQGDGKIVVAGTAVPIGGSSREFALARYNTDGSLDDAFGSGGIVLTPGTQVVNGLAIQPADGKIIAAGNAIPTNASALARYNPDGTLDATFGTGGIVAPTFGQGDTAVALQPDGKIVTTAVNSSGQYPNVVYDFGIAR